MDEQERELKQLLDHANRLLKQYSISGQSATDPRFMELSTLREGIHQELTRYQLHDWVKTMRKGALAGN
jgi:hypothetical protein